jgi:hypothetical protein
MRGLSILSMKIYILQDFKNPGIRALIGASICAKPRAEERSGYALVVEVTAITINAYSL